MILGDGVSKLETFVWILNHNYFKVHSLVSVHPKSIIITQMTNLKTIFHVVKSVYQFVKIWNLPQFPAEFGKTNFSSFLPKKTLVQNDT